MPLLVDRIVDRIVDTRATRLDIRGPRGESAKLPRVRRFPKTLGWWWLVTFSLASCSHTDQRHASPVVDIGHTLSRADMAADLDSLVATFERVHPNPYRFTTRAQRLARLDSLKASLPDQLPMLEFWRLVDRVTCEYTDAHSYVHDGEVLSAYVNASGRFFPVLVTLDSAGMVVMEHDGGAGAIPTGARITRINGVSTPDIIEQLAAHSCRETRALAMRDVSDDVSFFLWKMQDWGSSFSIHYISADAQGAVDSVTLDGATWANRPRAHRDVPVARSFTMLDGNVGYMRVTDFEGDARETRDFFRESFERLRDRKAQELVIDFRGHTGGRDSFGEDLAQFFAGTPYRRLRESRWHITPEFREAFDDRFVPRAVRWFPPVYLINEYSRVFFGSSAYDTVLVEHTWRTPLPESERFRGRVFLITDHQTFSAGSIFAEMFRHFNMGISVGQPTGNLQSFNGFALATFVLPRSGVTFQVSSVFNVANSGELGARSVEPDHQLPLSEDPLRFIIDRLIE